MEDKFKSAYQDWFDQQNEPVPEDVWEHVQDQLDIDNAWQTIANRLDEGPLPMGSSAGRGWQGLVMVGWVAFFLLTIALPLNQVAPVPVDTILSKKAPIAASTDEVPDQLPLQTSTAPVTTATAVSASPNNYPTEMSSLPVPSAETTATAVGESVRAPIASSMGASNNGIIPPRQERVSSAMPTFQASGVIMDKPNPEVQFGQLTTLPAMGWSPQEMSLQGRPPILKRPVSHPFFALTHIGVEAAVKNTWLINPETRYGMESSSLIDTRTSWTMDIGIRLQGVIKGKHLVGADVLLVSPTRQDYNQYLNARYVARRIDLQYQRLQLYYLQPLTARSQLLLGTYVARLGGAAETVGDMTYSRTQEFRRLDYGLVAGFQQQYPLWRRWSVQVGAQAVLGLPNIYKGSAAVPANLNRTREASFNITGGLVYQLKK